jgi:hypothetical protein
MKQLFYIVVGITGLMMSIVQVQAQELNAKVTVNADKITSTNKQLFSTLETSLNEFLNTTKWTQATFGSSERIECSFNIIINTQSEEINFQAELQVVARRPVYNSSYVTNLLNFRDQQLDFTYIENTPIEFIETRLESNLVATLAFYAYVIIGLDSDSFAPMGGSPYFRAAQQLANDAQSYSWTGWAPFEKSNNRHGVITALTDEGLKDYRSFWYTYHRKGLDEMAANADRGRTTILSGLPALKQTQDTRPGTVLLQMFADSKLDELANIYTKANSQEKKEGYDLLSNLFPTMSDRLATLKK